MKPLLNKIRHSYESKNLKRQRKIPVSKELVEFQHEDDGLEKIGSDPATSSKVERRMTGKIIILVSGAAFLLALLLLRKPASVEYQITALEVSENTEIEIQIAESFKAGEPITGTISGLKANTRLSISAETGYAKRTISATPTKDVYEFEFPAIQGPASGAVVINATQENRTASKIIEITPDKPVDPIDVYLGPRTVIADEEHFVMQVAVPEDKWGNPIDAGTGVDFSVTRSDQSSEEYVSETKNLLAWIEIFSTTTAGRTRVSTSIGNIGAAERDFLEVAGIPTDFTVELVDPLVPADGHALIRVTTSDLTDEFGNVMPDGTSATLDTKGATGVRRISGQTIDGKAEFVLQAPDKPGVVTLSVTASGTQSEPLEIIFESGIDSFEATATTTDGKLFVNVGPVISARGSFVPDGTKAKATLDNGETKTVEIEQGYAKLEFPSELEVNELEIEILGQTKSVEVKQ